MYANEPDNFKLLKKYLWGIKVPMKIGIFLYKKYLLTKNNLAKRRRNGCTKCVFCDSHETLDHIFIYYLLSRLVWGVVHFTYNILHQLM
jgi:hypothetical protein